MNVKTPRTMENAVIIWLKFSKIHNRIVIESRIIEIKDDIFSNKVIDIKDNLFN